MAVKLNTTSSIIDYLSSQKKPSDFSSRASLFKSSGLETRLGKYTGSNAQNQAFLKSLQTPSQDEVLKTHQTSTINPSGTGLENPLSLGTLNLKPPPKVQEYNAGFPLAPTNAPSPDFSKINLNTANTTPNKLGATSNQPIDFSKINVAPPIDWSKINLGGSPTPASQAISVAGGGYQAPSTTGGTTEAGQTGETAGTPSIPQPPQTNAPEVPPFATGGTPTAQDFGITNPTESEITDEYFNSSEYKSLREKYDLQGLDADALAQTAKEDLEAKFSADKTALEERLGRAGLFFSGIRSSQVAALAQSLAMSLNQVDRATAQKLLESDSKFKEDIFSGITDLMKEAKADNKDALSQLNQAGFVMIGNQIVPSLASQKYESAEERAKQTQELSILSFKQKLNEFDALEKQRAAVNARAQQQLQISMRNAITGQERNALLNQLREISILQKTAVSPGQIINAQTGLPIDLTKLESDDIKMQMNLSQTVAPQIESLLNKVTTGGVTGRYMQSAQAIPFLQNTLSNDQQALINSISTARNYIYTLSGKQINEIERQNLIQQLPRLEYTNAQNRTQLQSFTSQLNDVLSKNLTINGWAVAGSEQGNIATNNLITSELLSSGDSLDSLAQEYGAE